MKVDEEKSRPLSSSSTELESPDAELERDRFKERLRSIIPRRGENALASRAGISPSGLRGALKNGNPGREMLVAIAREAGVFVEWLATGEGPRDRPATDGTAPPGWGEERMRRAAGAMAEEKASSYQASSRLERRQPPGATVPAAPALPVELPRLAACLEAVQRLPEAMDAQRQLTLAYAMIGLIHHLEERGYQPNRLDREDLACLAGVLYKAVVAA